MKYRKKPVEVEAIQYNGDNPFEVIRFSENHAAKTMGSHLVIHTLEGSMQCLVDDWVIKGVKGEFYPCKPDIFEATYEKVEE